MKAICINVNSLPLTLMKIYDVIILKSHKKLTLRVNGSDVAVMYRINGLYLTEMMFNACFKKVKDKALRDNG